MWTWTIAALIACAYCIAKAVIDIRARRFIWGIVGLVSAAIFMLWPTQTHVVKVDLPTTNQ
ncbi:hypothetical protein EQG66_01165 [Sphingobium fluviale]|uniref:Uncharacterized protein n=1 Tax=Sphingobium fluviale TaxID=2506423 RepID=A0A4Q1KM28_9SPHN|nr:hypothetical protein EQG66_01165 [Sphingobium fluviale]